MKKLFQDLPKQDRINVYEMKFEDILARIEFIKSTLQLLGTSRVARTCSEFTEYETNVFTSDQIKIIKSFVSFTGTTLSEQHIVTKIKLGNVGVEVFDIVEEL